MTHLELCEKWAQASDFFNLDEKYPNCRLFRGGVEFDAPLEMGLSLNPLLRTNTRALLRLKSFEAPNEKAFLQGLAEIDWSQFFPDKSYFDFSFTSKSSKLSMKNQIQRNLEASLKKQKVKYKKGAPTIFVRMFRDQCNISLDCTGDAAFKRGNQKGSIASLRESTANGLLRLLFQGVGGPFALIDPMCGSGTFLLEALQMGQPMEREFNYQNFPIFNKNTEALRGEKPPWDLRGCFGFDNSEKALSVAKKNLPKDEKLIAFEKADLFEGNQGQIPADKLETPEGEELKRLVVLNPPWGKRLPGTSQDILKAVYEKYKPHRIGLLMPAHWKINPIPMEKARDIPILNSGVENRFLIFT